MLEWRMRALNPTLPLQQGEILKCSVKPLCCVQSVPVQTVQVHPTPNRLGTRKKPWVQESKELLKALNLLFQLQFWCYMCALCSRLD